MQYEQGKHRNSFYVSCRISINSSLLERRNVSNERFLCALIPVSIPKEIASFLVHKEEF
jgi:hypothetical protein